MKHNKTQNEFQQSNKKNKGNKASGGKIRPFSYTAFKNYGASDKKKRKRN